MASVLSAIVVVTKRQTWGAVYCIPYQNTTHFSCCILNLCRVEFHSGKCLEGGESPRGRCRCTDYNGSFPYWAGIAAKLRCTGGKRDTVIRVRWLSATFVLQIASWVCYGHGLPRFPSRSDSGLTMSCNLTSRCC